MTIRVYGDNAIEVDGCLLRSRNSVEKFADDLVELAKRIWPDNADEEVKDKK